MSSEFLNNLKKAVEVGEFNSEAAKKINEISKLAEVMTGGKPVDVKALEEKINNRLETSGIKTVDKETTEKAKADYDKEMEEIREKDSTLQQIQALNEVEELVTQSLTDLKEYIVALEANFDKTNLNYSELFVEIDKAKAKYFNLL